MSQSKPVNGNLPDRGSRVMSIRMRDSIMDIVHKRPCISRNIWVDRRDLELIAYAFEIIERRIQSDAKVDNMYFRSQSQHSKIKHHLSICELLI